MGHYKSNLRDIDFNIFEVFGGTETFGSAAYPDLDPETARTILGEMDRLAVAELVAGSNRGGLRSASAKESASSFVASRSISDRMVRAVSGSSSG